MQPGPYVMLAVSDTGTGMSQEVLDKVFEPFFTTKEVGKGSGLGLSMVYGFVKQSGGHIKIYSEEGHGTTIKLYLPPARGQVEAAPARGCAAAARQRDHPGGGGRCAGAQLRHRAVAEPRLPARWPPPTAAAALALVDSGQPFDLLFTDVIMPGGMTGRQLAEEVAKRRPGIKVLYTSGYTDNAIVHHGRLDAGVLLLTKPYRKSQLAKMVRQALTGESLDGVDQDRVASTTPASVKISAAIWPAPSGSCSATAEATTPITGTAMVPIAATEAGSRASAANQLT